MTKSRCVKGWIDIGRERWLRTTEHHHLYVCRTMGGQYLAEVLRKRHSMAEQARFFGDQGSARRWAEEAAKVRSMQSRPWWQNGSRVGS